MYFTLTVAVISAERDDYYLSSLALRVCEWLFHDADFLSVGNHRHFFLVGRGLCVGLLIEDRLFHHLLHEPDLVLHFVGFLRFPLGLYLRYFLSASLLAM